MNLSDEIQKTVRLMAEANEMVIEQAAKITQLEIDCMRLRQENEQLRAELKKPPY